MISSFLLVPARVPGLVSLLFFSFLSQEEDCVPSWFSGSFWFRARVPGLVSLLFGHPMNSLLRMNVVETWFVAVWGLCWCNLLVVVCWLLIVGCWNETNPQTTQPLRSDHAKHPQVRAVFLAAVLVGECVVGSNNLYPPPQKPHSVSGERYEHLGWFAKRNFEDELNSDISKILRLLKVSTIYKQFVSNLGSSTCQLWNLLNEQVSSSNQFVLHAFVQ